MQHTARVHGAPASCARTAGCGPDTRGLRGGARRAAGDCSVGVGDPEGSMRRDGGQRSGWHSPPPSVFSCHHHVPMVPKGRHPHAHSTDEETDSGARGSEKSRAVTWSHFRTLIPLWTNAFKCQYPPSPQVITTLLVQMLRRAAPGRTGQRCSIQPGPSSPGPPGAPHQARGSELLLFNPGLGLPLVPLVPWTPGTSEQRPKGSCPKLPDCVSPAPAPS